MDIDNNFFVLINSYESPQLLTDISMYLHGYKNVEIAFFFFCAILIGIVLGSPKKGMRAALAVFIAAMFSVFGSQLLKGYFLRPFPYLDDSVASQLRVEPISSMSAFPVSSIVLFCSVAVALIYYFPKYSGLVIIASIIYTLMPVHLGVVYPSDAFGSLLLGYVFSYVMMSVLGKKEYFRRL